MFIIICAMLVSCGKKESSSTDNRIGEELEISLREFENRKRYSSFTADTLKGIPDDRLEIAIIDHITDVKLKGSYREEHRIVTGMSRGFRYIYITWNLSEDMGSGGFIRYFYNTSGVFSGELLDALHNIGAFKTEKIAAEAVSLYNKERDLHERVKNTGPVESFMSSYGESELARLDELFYKSGEDLSRLRIRYIRDNPDQFITE